MDAKLYDSIENMLNNYCYKIDVPQNVREQNNEIFKDFYINTAQYGKGSLLKKYSRYLNDIKKRIPVIVERALKDEGEQQDENLKEMRSKEIYIHSDIHGHMEMFIKNLYTAGLIDGQGNWIAENKKLVQVGDFLDKGPYPAETYFYLRTLQEQARSKNSEVVILLGTHEKMLINKEKLASMKTFTEHVGKRIKKAFNGNFWHHFIRGHIIKAVSGFVSNFTTQIGKLVRGIKKMQSNNVLNIMLKEDIVRENICAAVKCGDILISHAGLSNKAIDILSNDKELNINKSLNKLEKVNKIADRINEELIKCVRTNNFSKSEIIGGKAHIKIKGAFKIKIERNGIVHTRELLKEGYGKNIDEKLGNITQVVGHMPTKPAVVTINDGNSILSDVGLGDGSGARSFLSIDKNNNICAFDKVSGEWVIRKVYKEGEEEKIKIPEIDKKKGLSIKEIPIQRSKTLDIGEIMNMKQKDNKSKSKKSRNI